MAIKQISVFLENHPGSLESVMGTLSDAGADMRALSMADTQDFGILRLIVRDTDKAVAALKEQGYVCSINDVTAAIIPDETGGLHKVLKVLADENINIEYSYAFLTPEDGKACVVFRIADNAHAAEVLGAKGISSLDGDDMHILG